MKIAIIGSGPLAIETALDFHSLGAQVVLYAEHELGGAVLRYLPFAFLSMEKSWEEITSESGRKLVKLEDTRIVPTLKEYYQDYLKKLIDMVKSEITIKPYKAERVHKRFLDRRETIPDHSRLHDLFRVVYGREDEEGPMEFFDDYDLVIEAIGSAENRLLGPAGSPAINEKHLKDKIHYRLNENVMEEVLKFEGTLTIVGDSVASATLLLFLKSWLGLSQKNNLYIVQEGLRPFENLEGSHPLLDGALTDFINEEKKHWQTQCRGVEDDIEVYRNLPREEQIKRRMPEFPEPRLKILTGYNTTSVDHLTDRDGLFLTLEAPEWRDESNKEIFTLNCGMLFVLKGSHQKKLGEHMPLSGGPIHEEPGYYTLGQSLLDVHGGYSLAQVLPEIQVIKDNVMSFFSRSES